MDESLTFEFSHLAPCVPGIDLDIVTLSNSNKRYVDVVHFKWYIIQHLFTEEQIAKSRQITQSIYFNRSYLDEDSVGVLKCS